MMQQDKRASAWSAFPTRDKSIIRELKRLGWLSLAFYLFLALVTFSPEDPSWTTWSAHTQYRNWMGRTGSILSDILFQCFGLAAVCIPLLLFRKAIWQAP